MDGSLVIMEGSSLLRFCYSNGWYPSHYGTWSIVEIFVTPIDGSLVIIEGGLLSRFMLLQWMVALSIFVEILVTIMDCSLVIMEDSLLPRFLLLQWMVDFSLWKVVCCRDFYYSN